MVTDLRAEEGNACESMHVNSESFSNEIDESEPQNEKDEEQRT
jgi:hypothetical protein